jgi:hypothetical protein
MANLMHDYDYDHLPQSDAAATETDEQRRLRSAAYLIKSAMDRLADIASYDDRVATYRRALNNIQVRLLHDADTREPKVGSE